MTIEIRILAGFIEINGDRVAQILPKVDERTVREHLEQWETQNSEDVRGDAYDLGYYSGEEKTRIRVGERIKDLIMDADSIVTKEIADHIIERLKLA